MSVRIIIPVKPFAEAKQRLAPALSEREREVLATKLFEHVFATAIDVADASDVMVVSRSPEILEYASSRGASAVGEATSSDLNGALVQAAKSARSASALLVVASDLPLLRGDDLDAMLAEKCAIAPDRRDEGTNALVWPTIPSPGFFFGANSFERHRAAAIAAGFVPRIVRREGLAHDIDTPDDLLPL